MRRVRLIAGFAALAVAATACEENVTGERTISRVGGASASTGWRIDPEGDLNSFFDCLAETGATLVSAHRGGPASGFPENALETMAETLRLAPAIMEADVAASADGVLYLMHDSQLGRTTNGEGGADALAWSDIRALRLVDGDGRETRFAPPSFADALAWAEGRTILQLDFKRSARYEDAAREIIRQGAEDRVILIAYSLGAARKLHRLLPDTMISLNLATVSELNAAVAGGIPADRLLAFTGDEAPPRRFISSLDERRVETVFATLGGRGSIDAVIERSGDDGRYAEIAAEGVDIIATDRPVAAHTALTEAGRAVEPGECGVAGPGEAQSAPA